MKKTKTQFEKGFEDAIKACGGCTLCYGKGYSSTVKAVGPETGRGPVDLSPQISFCGCSRGQQLRDILEKGRFDITN